MRTLQDAKPIGHALTRPCRWSRQCSSASPWHTAWRSPEASCPGVAFHVLFNISGTNTAHAVLWDSVTVGIIAVVMIPYILFLRNRLAKAGPAVSAPAVKVA